MEKIKILQSIRQGVVGGGETHVMDLVAGLDKDRFEPVVLSFTQGPMVDQLREREIKTYVVETTKPFNVLKWVEVREIMSRERIQLLHAHGTRAASNTFYSAKQLKLPIIYTVHGWSFHNDQTPLIKRVRIASERYLVHQASKTICVSQSNYDEGNELFKLESNACVIRNGVNQDRFNLGINVPDIRAELGIGPEVVLVGFIARVTAQKDPLALVQAISKLPQDCNIKLLMVGDGDLKEDAIQLALKLGVDDRIIFLPFRRDVPALLKAIDIYCLPSLWEGLSIALLEAMAMRKPIVATPVNGTKEVLVDKQNGIFVEIGNPQSLADAFVLLAKDTTLRENIANGAFDTISRQFNIRNMITEIEQLYMSLVVKADHLYKI